MFEREIGVVKLGGVIGRLEVYEGDGILFWEVISWDFFILRLFKDFKNIK